MPELPEVTVIVNQLDKKLKGLVLNGVEYDWPKKFLWGKYSVGDLVGKKVEKVGRRGKIVVLNLQNAKLPKTKAKGDPSISPSSLDFSRITILIHLKLTGQLIYQDEKTRLAGGHPLPPLNRPAPNNSTRAIFSFVSGGKLFFNDLRKFGWVKVVENKEEEIRRAIGAELGPDPLETSFAEFKDRILKKKTARIKKHLMDQQIISGVGNIYSDEALWRAKIHPKRIAGSLSEAELKALFKGIKDSLKLAIDKGGSSANAYVDSGGEAGLYLSFAKAYHMTGRPCARCRTPIVREKMDSRSAHFCPRCQQLK